MEITRTTRGDGVGVRLEGRMDAAWSDHVGQALEKCVRDGHHVIAIDMAGVEYISSAGIRVLIIHARRLQSIHGRLCVVRPSEPVRDVLELAGLTELLQADATEATTPSDAVSRELPSLAGAAVEVFQLAHDTTLRVRAVGDPASWLTGDASPDTASPVELPNGTIAVGLGSLSSGGGEPVGELLAAGGAAVCQPADGEAHPDFTVTQQALVPRASLAYGLLAEGRFSRLLRFEGGDEAPELSLSALLHGCLDVSGSSRIGVVGVAETGALVGAALRRPPQPSAPEGLFSFPAARDRLSFTAEPAFTGSVSLVVGFASRGEPPPGHPLLRPLLPSGELIGHFHAAAFPYRPVRKGRVELAESVQRLFDNETVSGVLHLVNDWRDPGGAGESHFLRGGLWFGPLEEGTS